MFDEPPANLPVEPSAGPAPLPPLNMNATARPAASVPKPAAAAPVMGSVMAKKQEPEDIFGDLEKSAAEGSGGSAMDMPGEHHGGGRGLRTALIVVGALAVLIVLGIGGYMLYDRFIAAPPVVTPPVTPPDTETLPSGTDTLPDDDFRSNPEQDPSMDPETPPVVEPTPPPEDIPLPVPVSPTTQVDTDGDGLSDARETSLGSNPSISDTDGDGLIDGEEADGHGSSPTVTDSDGDGLTDGDEVRVWNTNPTNPDTDGDSYADGAEVRNGFNPNGAGKLPATAQ